MCWDFGVLLRIRFSSRYFAVYLSVYLKNHCFLCSDFPFISSSSIWHISLLFTCHTPPFPRMTHVKLLRRISEAIPALLALQSPGYWGCRCSLDPTAGRLQRPSGKHRTVHEPWDSCFWTYPLGCFTRSQLGSRGEPRGRWGGWSRGLMGEEEEKEVMWVTHGQRLKKGKYWIVYDKPGKTGL